MNGSLLMIAQAASRALRGGAFPAEAGDDAATLDDHALDARGLAEVAAARERLRAQWPADARVVCSPGRAAQQTADALGALGLTDPPPIPLETDPLLADIDYAAWRGRRLAALAENEADALFTWLRDPDAAPHGGESLADAARRIGRWMDALPVDPNAHVVAIASTAIVRSAMVHALGAHPSSLLRIDVAPLACLAFTRRVDGSWVLRVSST